MFYQYGEKLYLHYLDLMRQNAPETQPLTEDEFLTMAKDARAIDKEPQ